MSRLTRLTYRELPDAQREIFDTLARDRRNVQDGHIGGPFDPWIRSPELARRAAGIGDFFRFRTSLNRRIVELAILVTGRFWTAQFEWFAHEPMAREAGLAEHVISAIRENRQPEFDNDEDKAAYELCCELHATHQVSDLVFDKAKELFGDQGVAEIINLIGYYTMVSMTLNTFQVSLPEGAKDPLN